MRNKGRPHGQKAEDLPVLQDVIQTEQGRDIRCKICPRACQLTRDQVGFCGNRGAIEDKRGQLMLVPTKVERIDALNVDPIEKKPLYHFYPGRDVLSMGLPGCNMTCEFCQNHHLSQKPQSSSKFSFNESIIEDVLKLLTNEERLKRVPVVAYTYSEPMTWYEFVYQLSQEVQALGFRNVIVTNGMIRKTPLKHLTPFIDGANIDVKGFKDSNYQKLGGDLGTVLETVDTLHEDGVHVELTYLVIPGFNDQSEEVSQFVQWVSRRSQNIPVHFSRYFPNHRMTHPSTPIQTLKTCYEIARGKLNYAYLGNVQETSYQTTYCANCSEPVIERHRFQVQNKLLHGCCPECGEKIPGVFEE